MLELKDKANRRAETLAIDRLHHFAAPLAVMLAGALTPLASLQADEEAIPNITVTDTREHSGDELLGSKISLPASDIPLSAERLNADVIERTGFTSLGPLLQATTSVTANPADGSAFNDYLLRGFANTPVYRNGISASIGDMPARVLANIARIEVLKGPYGALYGPGEPGGSINFVTKQPQSKFATDLEVGFGSYGEWSLQLDSTGPLVPRTAVDYRLIARREQSDTFRDFVKRDRIFINPMVSWQASSRVRYDASFEYLSDERLFDSGLAALDGDFPLPRARFLGEPASGTGSVDGYTFQLASLVQLDFGWELDLSLNGQKAQIKGNAVEPESLLRSNGSVLLNRSATRRQETSRALIAQGEASGIVTWWDRPHHVLFGVSATGFNEDTEFLASDTDDDAFAIDVFAPRYGASAPQPLLERDSRERTRQVSIYAQDLVEIGPRWRLLLGLRFDHIDQSGSDAASGSRFDRISDEVSPRFGLVFKPDAYWSLFASYSGSIDPNEGLRPDGGGLAPTKSQAVETGVKWKARDLPLSIDASLFVIKQTNVTTDAPGNPGFELQTGEQESIGAEIETRFDPLAWLTMTTRYSFVDAQILNDVTIGNGTTPLNVAKHQFSALALMRASLFKPNDLSLAISLNYLSDRQASLEPDELSLKLPAYFRGDVFLTLKHSQRLSFRLGIENFSDEEYFRGSQSDARHLLPGEPLIVRGQVTLSY